MEARLPIALQEDYNRIMTETKITEVYKPDAGMKKVPVAKKNKGNMPVSMEESLPSYPPSFHVNDRQMPEIKGWKVGEKYKMTIQVEQKNMNEGEKGLSAGFDIVAYKIIK